MQKFNGLEVVYHEMMEDQKGLFIAGAPTAFQASDSLETEAKAYSMSLQEAAESWASLMRSAGSEVIELPRTPRTREWGLSYSVTARGEESRIFVIRREH